MSASSSSPSVVSCVKTVGVAANVTIETRAESAPSSNWKAIAVANAFSSGTELAIEPDTSSTSASSTNDGQPGMRGGGVGGGGAGGLGGGGGEGGGGRLTRPQRVASAEK